jgi:hypothetical protein
MTTDKSIFGLRFQSNEEVLPSREVLKRFCRFELKLPKSAPKRSRGTSCSEKEKKCSAICWEFWKKDRLAAEARAGGGEAGTEDGTL